MSDPKRNIAGLQIRKARLADLEKLLGSAKHISQEEYVRLLREIRHNYTVLMAMRSVTGTTTDTGAYMAIVEKVHYLIDSSEGKPNARIDIQHKVESEKRLELRKLLTDPKNAGDILQIEGVLLDKLADA